MRGIQNYTSIFNAKAATGWTNPLFVGDAKTVIVTLRSASSANLTVKFAGSIGAGAEGVGKMDGGGSPDFTAAASQTNAWDYVQGVNLLDGSAVPGGTGIVFSGTDKVVQVQINVDGFNYLALQVSARSAGNVSADVAVYADNPI